MDKFFEIEKLVGHTPMICITYQYKGHLRKAYFKLEWYNLTGSTKDRVSLYILKQAYLSGTLKPNQPIVETTSGNMGISFSAIGKYLGHKVVIFMPKNMSIERQELIKLYGAELHLCDSFDDCFKEAYNYSKTHNAFLTSQFDNPNNTLSHYQTTAVEILEKIKNPTCFLAGVGTSGTLMGVGKYLKEKCDSKIIAIEPKSSMLLTHGISLGHHKLQGLADDIIPSIYNRDIVDDIISVTDNDAIAMARKLSSELGLGVGISSGANFIGAVLSNIDNAISIFTDDNKKYISTDLAKDIHTPLVDNIELISYTVL